MGRTAKLMCLLGLSGAVVLGLGMRVRRAQEASPGEKRKSEIAKPYVAWSGAYSQIGERSNMRITSSKEWSDLWLRHVGKGGERDSFNRIVVPKVNFEECMVVAIFQGRKLNNNGVVLVSITQDVDKMKLRIENEYYQTGGYGKDAGGYARDVTAYGVFVIPRSSKELVLEEDVQDQMGGPPVWRERVRFGTAGGSPY